MSSNTVTYAQVTSGNAVTLRATQQWFFGVAALLFAGSAALTVGWCESMSVVGGMPMPGGWTMSMAWMRMPDQTWVGAAILFLGMWVVMMVAMMLPSLTPMLWGYRQAFGRMGEARLNGLTALLGAGYFAVWAVLGMVVFTAGDALAAVEMRHAELARAVPIAAGVVVLMAGALQFSKWKAHHLGRCREIPGCNDSLAAGAGMAWKRGLRLGVHCICGCAGWTAMLIVMGLMDWRVMAVVTGGITVERILPPSERTVRALGAVMVGAGLVLIGRAAALR